MQRSACSNRMLIDKSKNFLEEIFNSINRDSHIGYEKYESYSTRVTNPGIGQAVNK